MNKKVILELTNAYGSAYCASEGERINITHIDCGSSNMDDIYDYSTEFACIVVAFIDFNDMYSIQVKRFLENDKDHDTLIIKCDLMQYIKKLNKRTNKELINDLCHAYKTIKMAGHRRPDEIYYQSDRGKVDEYCIHSLWEAAVGDVKECTYEFSNLVEDSEEASE